MTLKNAVRRLVVEECANHSRELGGVANHCCCRQPARCLLFYEANARCAYFEKAVLPLDRRLEALYRAGKKAEAAGYQLTRLQQKLVAEAADWAGKSRAVCAVCGQPFPARSNRQKRCGKCGKQALRDQARARMRNKRQKSG